MRIAVASTGLGHIARGIEAWAKALAEGLANQAKSMEHGGKGKERESLPTDYTDNTDDRIEVTLFAAGEVETEAELVVLPCLRRNDKLVRLWTKLAPGFTWRWGWKAGYSIEQRSFVKLFIPHLKSGKYDVVHTQDVILAEMLEKARKKGLIKTPVILAHGTDEDADYLKQFSFIQHLAPEHEKKFRAETHDSHATSRGSSQRGWVIPNFVDVEKFCPEGVLLERQNVQGVKVVEDVKQNPNNANLSNSTCNDLNLRKELGIPSDAFVVGCSAALKFSHKRLDYLIKEYASYTSSLSADSAPLRDVFLLLAGATSDETSQVERLAQELLGDKCIILKDLPFDEMPDFYRSLDLFVLPALEEVFGIVFLEAMSCGVPCIAHDAPTTRWVVGEGGECVDMRKSGVVAQLLSAINKTWLDEKNERCRKYVVDNFSYNSVGGDLIMMYEKVVN